MQPEVRKLMEDVQVAANSIAEFSARKSSKDFADDKLLRAGIYYEFVIIGEAIVRLRAIDEAIVQQISEHSRIIAFRNQIIHGYAKVDDEITWRIIQDKLPILQREVAELLR